MSSSGAAPETRVPQHALRERALGILADLIAFPSVSTEPNLDIVGYVRSLLAAAGAHISLSYDDTRERANVFATVGPEVPGGVILSGHTDVVAATNDWTSDPFVAATRGTRVYGRGACDMKAFLACALATAPVFAEAALKRPVHFAFTYDEEVGCHGAKVLVDDLRKKGIRPAMCIVGEPTSMHAVEAHKGCNEYTTEFLGVAAHASDPRRGVSAVHFAARFVGFLIELGEQLKRRVPPASPFNPPWTTIQAGTIAGGSARNVVAADCRVEWEFRPVSREDEAFVVDAVRTYVGGTLLPEMRTASPDAQIIQHTVGEVAGLMPTDDAASKLVQRLNGGLRSGAVSFGTEAGLYQSVGISTVVCGPGSIAQAHTVDEFIEVEQIDRCLALMVGLAGELEQTAR